MTVSAPDRGRQGGDGLSRLPLLVPGVSRETRERLGTYVSVLRRWQASINLVGRATLDEAETRHILDSAQLHPLLPDGARVLVDLGSGAGFPGLVLAILGVPEVHLIESDTRKCAFLREVARITETPVTIHNRRIETVEPFPADVVTSRALAPLDILLGYAVPFTRGSGACLFLKGRQAEEELAEARRHWTMNVEQTDSITDPGGTVLRIREVKRA
jgi:16S rRNA (guanine527-N7)-methyltransferase